MYVIEVFARVARVLPARLMLIGDGPDRSAAEQLALHYKVQDRIHFIGKQDNVNELLPLADIMLMPSEMESFGLAALEAMACGRPVAGLMDFVVELLTVKPGPVGRPEYGSIFALGWVSAG